MMPFCWAIAMLIYPILEEGQRSREITLPRGRWYHVWDDLPLEGTVMLRYASRPHSGAGESRHHLAHGSGWIV